MLDEKARLKKQVAKTAKADHLENPVCEIRELCLPAIAMQCRRGSP